MYVMRIKIKYNQMSSERKRWGRSRESDRKGEVTERLYVRLSLTKWMLAFYLINSSFVEKNVSTKRKARRGSGDEELVSLLSVCMFAVRVTNWLQRTLPAETSVKKTLHTHTHNHYYYGRLHAQARTHTLIRHNCLPALLIYLFTYSALSVSLTNPITRTPSTERLY